MQTVSASTTIEIELDLSGTFVPGYPDQGPTYSSGGEPGQPDMVEDLDVTGLFALKYRYDYKAEKPHWDRVDLFKGLSAEARNTIIQNLLEATRSDAEDALLSEAA